MFRSTNVALNTWLTRSTFNKKHKSNLKVKSDTGHLLKALKTPISCH